jgi:hypothetical protein
VLDVPNLCVNRIFLEGDSETATINFNARLANLVRVNAGAEVLIGRVELTIEEVRAQALLERTSQRGAEWSRNAPSVACSACRPSARPRTPPVSWFGRCATRRAR